MALDVSEAVAAQLAGKTIRIALLIMLDFMSGAQRYWIGRGTFTDGLGMSWSGLPIVVAVEFGRMSSGGAAEQFMLRLSGVETAVISLLQSESSEAVGRRIELWFQLCDDTDKPLDDPFMVRAGRILGFTFSGNAEQWTVTTKCESIFTARGMSPAAYLSNMEQQLRFSGDRGLEYIPYMQNRTVQWPKFV